MLQRNPQYLTPRQIDALKQSILRDGFVAPILVRPRASGRYEIVSGNHRFMAAKELGAKRIPAIIVSMTDRVAKRLAVNLNTVHGDPGAELLAPYLADLDDAALGTVYLSEELTENLVAFDATLLERLEKLDAPKSIDRPSPTSPIKTCKCPKCGKDHLRR